FTNGADGDDWDEHVAPQSPTVDKGKGKRKRYKGWKWLDEEDDLAKSLPVNNQDQFQLIARRAAEEATRAEPRKGNGDQRRVEGDGRAASRRREGNAGRRKKERVAELLLSPMEPEEEEEEKGKMNRVGQHHHALEEGTIDGPAFQSVLEETDHSDTVDTGVVTAGRNGEARHSDLSKDKVRPPSIIQGPPQYYGARSTEDEGTLDERVKEIQRLVSDHPSSLQVLKSHILSGLTSARRIPLVNLSDPYNKVHQLLSQTILAGEGNSMLVIGARGTGKTALVETAVEDLSNQHGQDFHVVRLNGFIHTDDKLALKEVWRQLGREMDVVDEMSSGRSNYADMLTSLLALLSHQEVPPEGGESEQQRITTKSVVFILDEFDLFASHPRQTLLYNLFDLAQFSTTPLAVLGLTTKVNVVELLEKRVKSRFGQRYVYLSAPRTLEAFTRICQEGLMFRLPTTSSSFSDKLQSGKSYQESANHLQHISDAWNTYITHHLLAHPILEHHLRSIYTTTKTPSTFHISALLP
ncbi:MAG: hypothetical protein Q9217_007081, partial [Psora testacea]